MSKQIDFLKRCIALNLQSGSLLDLLDRIEELERKVASREAEVVSLTNQRDYEYVRAENAEQERDQFEQERDQLREHVTMLRDELNKIYKLVPGLVVFQMEPSALAIMEPK